ncbi:uncharacterized protein LOC100559787 [Anolis carolinensis]|uniref:uncharacterized protein LOC100559787 n=1 Tax=Anolis carolinensis TaxID=28377 RepID=UPI002F2B52BB
MKSSLMAVTEATAWIRALKMGSKGNILNAVASALEDPACQSVYLFTNGLYEGRAEELWRYLKDAEQTRPVHTVYLVGSEEEKKDSSRKILAKVANEFGGSCQVLNLSSDGTSNEDKPGYTVSIPGSFYISKQHPNPWLTGHCRTQFPSSTWSPYSPNIFLEGSIKENLENWSSKFHNLQRGIRVLIRKQADGYYYPGHIVQKVKGPRGHVLVKFEQLQQPQKRKTHPQTQETPLYDIVDYEDSRWQPLAPGDAVLAPWEKKGRRYGPGIVLQVTEAESPHSVFKNSKVLVNFWNGQTKNVSADITVKIPPSLRERIVLELQMPLTAREMLVERSPDYPYVVPPGYRASGPRRRIHLDWMHCNDTHNVSCAGTSNSPAHLPHCYFCFPSWKSASCPVCTRQPDDTLVPEIKLTGMDEHLSKGRFPILEGDKMEKCSKLKKASNFGSKSDEKMESKVTKPNKDQLKDINKGSGVATKIGKCKTRKVPHKPRGPPGNQGSPVLRPQL